MLPGVVKFTLERMYHTCCRDLFIEARFPFIYKDKLSFIIFSLVFQYFRSAKGSKLDLNFELSWRSSWEASWGDVGGVLGGQDAP